MGWFLASLCCRLGALAALEQSQTMLTNLGQAMAKAPPMQLADTYVMVPKEFMRGAVQDAVEYQINQLAFADKVWGDLCQLQAGPACGSLPKDVNFYPAPATVASPVPDMWDAKA